MLNITDDIFEKSLPQDNYFNSRNYTTYHYSYAAVKKVYNMMGERLFSYASRTFDLMSLFNHRRLWDDDFDQHLIMIRPDVAIKQYLTGFYHYLNVRRDGDGRFSKEIDFWKAR